MTFTDVFASPIFYNVAVGQTAWMTLMWLLHYPLRNLGMVDFGWPSGFTFITLAYALSGPAGLRKWLIAIPYLFCGARFMFGWFLRTRIHGEDRRWPMWRERWANGEGALGVRSEVLNSLAFYQAQSLANIFSMTLPVAFAAIDVEKEIGVWEIAGVALWFVSFALENVADTQLAKFKANRNNRGGVCNIGLWKYSRHPNYFFEFLIWCSYALYTVPSCNESGDWAVVFALPVVAYYFLVHFTGVPMTEAGSLKHRGEPYRLYMERTSMFFPWFPSRAGKKD
eukprot:Opistho-2@83820